MISITQALRKITVQYAKRVVGRKVYGGQSSYLPLKEKIVFQILNSEPVS